MGTFIEPRCDLPLWAGMARRVDPPTAKAAGSRARRFAGGHRERIVEALAVGSGTKDQIAARCGMTEQQVARRMHELLRLGEVVVVGEAVSPTGCRETVYGRKVTHGR